jgi:hypothetical protein
MRFERNRQRDLVYRWIRSNWASSISALTPPYQGVGLRVLNCCYGSSFGLKVISYRWITKAEPTPRRLRNPPVLRRG